MVDSIVRPYELVSVHRRLLPLDLLLNQLAYLQLLSVLRMQQDEEAFVFSIKQQMIIVFRSVSAYYSKSIHILHSVMYKYHSQ